MGCSVGKEEDDINVVHWNCTACNHENTDGIACVACDYYRPEGDTTENAKMMKNPTNLQAMDQAWWFNESLDG